MPYYYKKADFTMYENVFLTDSLLDNVNAIYRLFNDRMLKKRFFSNSVNHTVNFCLMFFSNLIVNKSLDQTIIKPIMDYSKLFATDDLLEYLRKYVLYSDEITASNSVAEIIGEMQRGKAILFADRCSEALLIQIGEVDKRQIVEPQNEPVMRGPREGFIENLSVNLSMLRRRIISPELKVEFQEYGTVTKTTVCICYLQNIVDKTALSVLQQRLDTVKTDAVLDSNMIAEKIKDNIWSPFKTIGTTERPDTLAAKILEGKIGILTDGTPMALTVPYFFVENFQSSEDYYLNTFYASVGRILRVSGFAISAFFPAFYVSIISHHFEILPVMLASSIAEAEMDVPFPVIIECVVLLIVFELIRETSIRVSSTVGNALTIVGGFVIGQAVIEAKFFSAAMLIVIAITGITGLINQKVKGATIVVRLLSLAFGALFGIYGVFLSMILMMSHLNSMTSFGVEYSFNFLPFWQNIRDTFIRIPKNNIKK